MNKTLTVSAVVGFLLFVITPLFLIVKTPESLTITNEKVAYEMPYPGLLPDHPLYFLKAIRDRVVEFGTRDHIRKAQLYLLYSDKRAVMATALAKKGKQKLAISTFSKGEKYFDKIVPTLKLSKSQGVSPPEDLILKLKLSNAKHKEMLEDLLTELPQGEQSSLQQVILLNQKIAKDLQSL